jgi:hypothetical protein
MNVHKNARSCPQVESSCTNESPHMDGRCARRQKPPVSVIAGDGSGYGEQGLTSR